MVLRCIGRTFKATEIPAFAIGSICEFELQVWINYFFHKFPFKNLGASMAYPHNWTCPLHWSWTGPFLFHIGPKRAMSSLPCSRLASFLFFLWPSPSTVVVHMTCIPAVPTVTPERWKQHVSQEYSTSSAGSWNHIWDILSTRLIC